MGILPKDAARKVVVPVCRVEGTLPELITKLQESVDDFIDEAKRVL